MTEILYYIFCGVLSVTVMVGISLMSKVKTAVAGNLISAASVLLGIIVTLFYKEVYSAWSIFVFMFIGVLIGSLLAREVRMIQMPQLVALLNGVGGFASALVGILSLLGIGAVINKYPVFVDVTSVLAIVIGTVTVFGSVVAAAKLHKVLPQKPVIWRRHSIILNSLIVILIGVLVITLFSDKSSITIAIILIFGIVASSIFGYAFAIRVGGADMPITISLLNSLSGVAGAIAGMAVNDLLLVSVGGIVGASGLFLTQIMCKAMNRSLYDILLGKTSTSSKTSTSAKTITSISSENNNTENISSEIFNLDSTKVVDDSSEQAEVFERSEVSEPAGGSESMPKKDESELLKSAKSVIIVPGYGMALAQAQHLVKQLAEKFEANGAVVKFAIHPVAGRMPGHMNVLLAEADVEYDKLYEMDAINDEFAETDVVVVIGANDVINPAARDAKDTPIYGMPVLNVDQAKEVFICNFDLQPGYAGVDNPLYNRSEGVHMLPGDAKDSLNILLNRLNL